jgi:hypothetical protein
MADALSDARAGVASILELGLDLSKRRSPAGVRSSRVFLTGGSGFVGQFVLSELLVRSQILKSPPYSEFT